LISEGAWAPRLMLMRELGSPEDLLTGKPKSLTSARRDRTAA